MSNPTGENKKQKNKKLANNEASGSAYIREHAGHLEGYGEYYPNSKGLK